MCHSHFLQLVTKQDMQQLLMMRFWRHLQLLRKEGGCANLSTEHLRTDLRACQHEHMCVCVCIAQQEVRRGGQKRVIESQISDSHVNPVSGTGRVQRYLRF